MLKPFPVLEWSDWNSSLMMCPLEAICDGTSFPENVPNVVGSDRPKKKKSNTIKKKRFRDKVRRCPTNISRLVKKLRGVFETWRTPREDETTPQEFFRRRIQCDYSWKRLARLNSCSFNNNSRPLRTCCLMFAVAHQSNKICISGFIE